MKPVPACPFCFLGAGFHKWPCAHYEYIGWKHPELVGPGNSKEFMVWLKKKREENG